jgi:hypothetical protein
MQLENLLFILLIAIALLFRLLASKVGEAKNREQDPDQRSTTSPPPVGPITRAPAESDAERIRRFLEALGQPTDTKPPPPVAPRTDVPPRPLAPVQPPISPFQQLRRDKPAKRKVIPPPQAVTPTKEISPPKLTVAPAFKVHEGQLSVEQPPIIKLPAEAFGATQPTKREELKTDIATLLASKSGLRNAIILREIFGPPRSLQPLDLVGRA